MTNRKSRKTTHEVEQKSSQSVASEIVPALRRLRAISSLVLSLDGTDKNFIAVKDFLGWEMQRTVGEIERSTGASRILGGVV